VPARQQLSILRHVAATVTVADDKNLPLRQRPLQSAGFTMLELIVVIGTIIILVAVVLGAAGYVQKKGSRSRAETEIAALSAALESYKADNGIYPRDTSTTDSLDARISADPTQTNYQNASLYLYTQLSATNADLTPIPGARSYFTFKPQMLGGTKDANGNLVTVAYICDPFGNSYGYSTAQAANPGGSAGYNPTYDLWSTAGTAPSPTPTPPATLQDLWIKNW
jgi:type II secretory pathway pseudopilin PulG